MNLKIGDHLWHPCSIDIIEHKIISIRNFEGFNHYVTKAVANVGACGRVEVILDEHKDTLRFIELVDEENIEYSSGLQDFIEGEYYSNKKEAQLEFYRMQEVSAWSNMDRQERLYKQSVKHYEKVKLLVKTIRESLNES